MKRQIDQELVLYRANKQPFSILMIDISKFRDFNRCYGEQDGDRLLAQTAKVITLNLRARDLACRYAGDRFVVLFPSTHRVDANIYSQEIINALENLAFKPSNAARSEFIHCNSSLVDHSCGKNANALLTALNSKLERSKREGYESKVA